MRFTCAAVSTILIATIAIAAAACFWISFHRQYDKSRVENRLSRVEVGTFIAITATAIASLLSNWIFYLQLDEMKVSRRPWISATQAIVFTDSPDEQNGQFVFPIAIILKNTGQSLATQVHAYLYASAGTGDDLTVASNEVCSKVPEDTPSIKRPYLSGLTLAPGETKNLSVSKLEGHDISLENIKRHVFWLHGCIKYRDSFNIPHHTRFCFVGRYIGPNIPNEDQSLGGCGGGEEAN